MKRLIYLLTCLAMTLSMAAQPGGHKDGQRHQFSPERYKQTLEEFVTREADITPDEAQRLYPIIHEMLEKQHKNNNEARDAMLSCKNDATEADYERAVMKSLELNLENKRIEQEYYKKLHTVLSWKKVHKVRIALHKFQMEALRRFSPHNGGGKRGGRHGHRERPVPADNKTK